MKCGAQSAKCEMEREVWSGRCKVRSVKWSAKCEL